MSWDEMSRKDKTCNCGKGTISIISEMDDWNRWRTTKEINCADCREESIRIAKENEKKARLRNQLNEEARNLAESRYLEKWLEIYQGLNKKQVWQLYTGGTGYPALGTFYKHVKDSGGVTDYLSHRFRYNFENILTEMKISDSEIDGLLLKKKNI